MSAREFEAYTQPAATLMPGQRVSWRSVGARVVSSVETANDGSGHLIVKFTDGPCARYTPNAQVRVLVIAPIDESELSADNAGPIPPAFSEPATALPPVWPVAGPVPVGALA